MDYEVFLMSRIREEHIHDQRHGRRPCKEGVAGVGRVIVAAALIMSTVFFAFLLNPDRVSKEFALLLGIAILTDALLMRMTLVPALLTVLGERLVVRCRPGSTGSCRTSRSSRRPSGRSRSCDAARARSRSGAG